MQTRSGWTRFEEPLRRTLVRNATIAAVVGAVLALLRNDMELFLPLATIALWPSLGGHFIEIAFLNDIRTRIAPGRVSQAVARLLTWFAGGVLLYMCMNATARAVPVPVPPPRPWWYGGLLFIGVELTVHAILAVRGLPNFYGGRG